ncbi:MAG: transglycosylase SLT domain-containing protein [Acidobacteria bacterium]|nr:transglycosylase SLT domain-containing protein [Acidobacteriota bacterium]MCA1640610.1 transglycosylase SLT domain-containing protein [Acidobacteriota bacterium]
MRTRRKMIVPSTLILSPVLYALALLPACYRAPSPNANSPAAAPASAVFFESLPTDEQGGDDALANARRLDRQNRGADGGLSTLPPQEHMRRAAVYLANRAFSEAREHWTALIAQYPADANVPGSLFGIGRSYYVERRYAEALPFFERLGRDFAGQKEGREGFYYTAATILRLGRPADAAARYLEYAERHPQGERIENAYLNAIDSWREAGRDDLARQWIGSARERFRGKPSEANALFALLRLEIAAGEWQSAVRAADQMRGVAFNKDVQTTQAEVTYLKAYALERSGQKAQAGAVYQSITDRAASYYGWQATEHLHDLGGDWKRAAAVRAASVKREVEAAAANFPAPNREVLLRAVKGKNVDPRYVLSIMRQESSFNTRARSLAGARGLLQLTIDVANKYAKGAGLERVIEDDLYRPEVNIPVGVEYLSQLFRMFPDLPEGVAASYNGGEDNVERWVRRAVHKDNGVFAAEIGFAESKDYALKVMANYRAYQQLYTSDLQRRR